MLVTVALVMLVGVPLISLCYKAGFAATATGDGWLRTWSATRCLEMVVSSPWRFRREFGWSLGIGALAATGALAAAIALAWPARNGGLGKWPALAAAAVCLGTPGPLVGQAIIWLLNRPRCPWLCWLYDQSILAPWIALFAASLPLAALIMWHAFRSIPRELFDCAAIDGAGSLGQLCRIALPCRLPAAALAWVVAMAVSLGDLAASILVAPPGTTTLSIRVFGLLHAGVEDQVAGICLGLIALFAAVAAVALWLATRWNHRSQKAYCR